MRKSVLVVVALLAIASLMGAMAYTTASVTSAMSVSLVNTDDALLALEASDYHDAAFYEGYAHKSLAKVLRIDLSKGYNGGKFGLQPQSTYTWNELFQVKNNSEHTVDVTVKLNPEKPYSNTDDGPGHFAVFARVDETWVKLADTHGGSELEFQLAPNGAEKVDFKVEVEKGYAEDFDFDLIIEADDTYR